MSSTSPAFFRSQELVLHLGGRPLLSSARPLSYQEHGTIQHVRMMRSIFAYALLSIPDLMASPSMAEYPLTQRLAQVAAQQAYMVNVLGKWKRQGFMLRFESRPHLGQIDAFILGRVMEHVGQQTNAAEAMARELESTLSALRYSVQPITDPSALAELLSTRPQSAIVEVRQKEVVLPLAVAQGLSVYGAGAFSPSIRGAYVVCAYSPRPDGVGTAWHQVFEGLLRERQAVRISVYLEPTVLLKPEQEALVNSAASAERLSRGHFEGALIRADSPDPVASLVARLNTSMVARLTQSAYLLAIQVESTDGFAAVRIARLIGGDITVEAPTDTASSGNAIPSDFDLVSPREPEEHRAALALTTRLELVQWGETQSIKSLPGKERLRYLVDTAAAAGAFRLPVPTSHGIPGMQSHQIYPGDMGGARTGGVKPGEVLLGLNLSTGGVVGWPLSIVARHTLVAGTNSSGKTTTVCHILGEVWKRRIPFLVIDPVRTEYRGLLVDRDQTMAGAIQVFTLGDESVSPFRLNPLEVAPGIIVESHLSRIKTCILASMPSFGALPGLVDKALHRVYQRHGWHATEKVQDGDARAMPILGELFAELIAAVRGT